MRNWEHESGTIWYFDFKENALKRAFTKKFLSKKGLNSIEVEQRINRLIEAPLKQCMNFLSSTSYREKITDWQHLRSLYLHLLFQNMRSSVAGISTDQENIKKFETIFLGDESKLDELVHFVETNFKIVIRSSQEDNFFCLPDVGSFMIPVKQKDNTYRWALSAPITPLITILLAPRTIDMEFFERSAHVLNLFCVGHNARFRKIIIPGYVKSQNTDQQITLHLTEKREKAISFFQGSQLIEFLSKGSIKMNIL